MSETWDDVRHAQIETIVAASARVTEADEAVSEAVAQVRRLERELHQARIAKDAADSTRDGWADKVRNYVEAYQHIGTNEGDQG